MEKDLVQAGYQRLVNWVRERRDEAISLQENDREREMIRQKFDWFCAYIPQSKSQLNDRRSLAGYIVRRWRATRLSEAELRAQIDSISD